MLSHKMHGNVTPRRRVLPPNSPQLHSFVFWLVLTKSRGYRGIGWRKTRMLHVKLRRIPLTFLQRRIRQKITKQFMNHLGNPLGESSSCVGSRRGRRSRWWHRYRSLVGFLFILGTPFFEWARKDTSNYPDQFSSSSTTRTSATRISPSPTGNRTWTCYQY